MCKFQFKSKISVGSVNDGVYYKWCIVLKYSILPGIPNNYTNKKKLPAKIVKNQNWYDTDDHEENPKLNQISGARTFA